MKLATLSVLAIFALSLFSFSFAYAQEETENTETTEVVVDDSTNQEDLVNEEVEAEIEAIDEEFNEDVSGWDVRRERMKNWFTFDSEKKSEREFKIARMLLVKARIEAKNGDTEAMNEAFEAHNKIVERIETRIRERAEEAESSEDVEKLTGLERAIQVHELRIERLNTLLSEEDLTNEERALIEERIAKAEEVSLKLEEIQEEGVERFKLRVIAKEGLSEEEIEAKLDEFREERRVRILDEATNTMREYRYERRERMKDGVLEVRERMRERIKDDLDDDSDDSGSDSDDDLEDEVEDESDDDSNSGVDDDSDDDDSDDDSDDSGSDSDDDDSDDDD